MLCGKLEVTKHLKLALLDTMLCKECQNVRRHESHHLDQTYYQSLRRHGFDSVVYELEYYYSETPYQYLWRHERGSDTTAYPRTHG